MLKHNIAIILRTFVKYKAAFVINLIGLSTGLTCSLLIYLWIQDEMSFDKFHEFDSRLYQVMTSDRENDAIEVTEYTPGPLANTLKNELPEVEYATSVLKTNLVGNPVLMVKDLKFKTDGLYATSDFFKTFSFDLISGDPEKALENKNAIAISSSMASKLFGDKQDVMGEMVEVENVGSFMVTGVFEDIPANSSLQFEYIIPMAAYEEIESWVKSWGNNGPSTYVVLQEGAQIDNFNDKIVGYVKKNVSATDQELFATKFSSAHLYGKYENGVQSGGRIEYIQLFAIIAISILLIASINFINLSTSKASRRMKEIGIKKALGSTRKALIFQYLGESILMCLISLAVSLIIVWLLLPQFNQITNKQLTLELDINLILVSLSIAIVIGLLAGSYPALYLSKIRTTLALKGKLIGSINEMLMRKGLVIFQFVISIVFIITVVVVYQQVKMVQTKDLGYDKDNVIYFDMEGNVDRQTLSTFLEELKSVQGVVGASSAENIIIGRKSSTSGVSWKGKLEDTEGNFEYHTINYGFIELLGIEIDQGRSFSEDYGTDQSGLILNQSAIELMGLKDPIGQTVELWGKPFEIIGIVKDFHFESLHHEVNPLIFRFRPKDSKIIVARIRDGYEKETLARMKDFYEDFNDGYSFKFKFMDEGYQAQYTGEQTVASLSKYFTGLAILISCLGLFGLASFTLEKRKKEIGVRKVLGSTDFQIIYMLVYDFLKMVLIAIVVGIPIGYYLSGSWLDGFAYKIELKWWIFALAAICAIFIALLTVGLQAYKAAKAKPTKSLKANE